MNAVAEEGQSRSAPRSSGTRGRIGRKLVLSFVALVMLVVGGSGWVLYQQAVDSLEQQMSHHLEAEARLLANGQSGDVLIALRQGFEQFPLYRRLTDRLRRSQQMVGAKRIYVFDRNCRSLLDTKPRIPIGREYPHLKYRDRMELEDLWQGRSTHSTRFSDEGGVDFMTGYAPIFFGGVVVAGVGLDIGPPYGKAIRGFKRSIFLFAGISALLTLAVALGLARNITRPIRRLVTAAREIGRGNLDRRVDTPADDEIGYLGETMEEMRRNILARDVQLRQMLGGVAHEIRNPLGGIEIYAGLIAEDLPDNDPRKQHIQKVIAEVRTLDTVISEFLDFARPSPPDPERTSVSQMVEETAFLLSPEMERAQVAYTQEVAPDLEAYVDAEQIKRALFNLMKNAVQAMEPGGTLTVRAKAVEEEEAIEVEVVDNGPGIPAPVRARLFEPFFTTREKGSGLGLAIVRQSLEKNGGWVRLESIEGEGTTVRVFLPAGRIPIAEMEST
jgi:signal transduction histidine kinase